MISADPRTAPARSDLPFLRHRRRPAPTPPPAARPASPGPGGITSLNLSDPPFTPAPPPVAEPVAPQRTPASSYQPPRLREGTVPTTLSGWYPTVTLTRLQSGIGVLDIEAVCSPGVGDLRLGCAYHLSTGASSVVQQASGITTGPARSRRPVLIADRGQYERLTLDLVQVRDLDRLAVYAFSESGGSLAWGGSLVISTYGGRRVIAPVPEGGGDGVVVMLSAYVVDGELVLRNESDLVAGGVRDACTAYGFTDIVWTDSRTPLV